MTEEELKQQNIGPYTNWLSENYPIAINKYPSEKDEKENEQLKCDLYNTDANLQHITIELEKENAELKKDKEWLDNTNNEQTEVILELQEQIEKMKNCSNCKHLREKHNENCIFIKSLNTIVCNKWEFEE